MVTRYQEQFLRNETNAKCSKRTGTRAPGPFNYKHIINVPVFGNLTPCERSSSRWSIAL